MKKDKRQKEVKLRKNFFPTLAVSLVLWLLIHLLIYFVEPDTFGALFFFFALSFAALFFTFSLAFANSRRGLVAAVALTLFLVLRFFGVGNILNFILITSLAVILELISSKKTL